MNNQDKFQEIQDTYISKRVSLRSDEVVGKTIEKYWDDSHRLFLKFTDGACYFEELDFQEVLEYFQDEILEDEPNPLTEFGIATAEDLKSIL